MGASMAHALATNSHDVLWSGNGRSAETRLRAEVAHARDCGSLGELCTRSEIIISVCPPESALELAASVAAEKFTGLYADVNAVAPERARQISQLFPDCYVDGGIVGPPAVKFGTTRLYLSGLQAHKIQQLFADSALEPVVLAGSEFAASALKMCYASWTKGSAALLLNTVALAESLNVLDSLKTEWARSQAGAFARAEGTIAGSAPKAWRFTGEMNEIAATFASADLPDGFHQGAADFYQRLVAFKGQNGVTLSDMFDLLVAERNSDSTDR